MLLKVKNLNNSQNFYITSFLSNFNRNYFSKKISYWILLIKIGLKLGFS